MSGPQDGIYLIQLAGDPKPLIGVDSSTAIVKPVVAGGEQQCCKSSGFYSAPTTLVSSAQLPVFLFI
jgi:hypothetical protein